LDVAKPLSAVALDKMRSRVEIRINQVPLLNWLDMTNSNLERVNSMLNWIISCSRVY